MREDYFVWMCGLVSDRGYMKGASFARLFHLLHHTEFTYVLDMDANRAQDGVDLRRRFGYEKGLQEDSVAFYFDRKPCSILEMMVALAMRCEEHIMDNPDVGNRTGEWFWGMVENLGLGGMEDGCFDACYILQVLDRFLNRRYKRNGEGGLFTVRRGRTDMRKAEIWYQAMWYLDEVLRR